MLNALYTSYVCWLTQKSAALRSPLGRSRVGWIALLDFLFWLFKRLFHDKSYSFFQSFMKCQDIFLENHNPIVFMHFANFF